MERLRAEGYRSGDARRAVVEHLGRQQCCLSAHEIYEGVRGDGRRVGIASVYRVLETLAGLGLVHRVDLGGGVARYEPAAPGGEHHHHLVCGDCGRVEPFSDDHLEAALSHVAGRHGYSLAAHDVTLHGACGECREEPAAPGAAAQ